MALGLKTVPPEFYDAEADERDERWAAKQRQVQLTHCSEVSPARVAKNVRAWCTCHRNAVAWHYSTKRNVQIAVHTLL